MKCELCGIEIKKEYLINVAINIDKVIYICKTCYDKGKVSK